MQSVNFCRILIMSLRNQFKRRYSARPTFPPQSCYSARPTLPPPCLNLDYLCDDANYEIIEANIRNRKGVGDIGKVRELFSKWKQETNVERREKLYAELIAQAADIPNSTHPDSPIGAEDNAITVETVGEPRKFTFKPRSVVELGENLGHLKTHHTTLTTGPRSYFFLDLFAKLETALEKYTLIKAIEKGFKLVSVPDIVEDVVIEAAGFKTKGERSQVYKLEKDNDDDPTLCLAGTAEIPLLGMFINECVDFSKLPMKFVTSSRCFRAEVSNISRESGIYRVHQFTKVELFGVTANETGQEGQELLQEIISIQKELFSGLGLSFRILNMPSEELGAPAYCKYDIETWMPNNQFWGEISSASNCTDFQARRIHLTYKNSTGEKRHCHTVNGTGCAIPRFIMAISENFQNKDGTITIPEVLRPHMKGQEVIAMSKLPKPRWIRSKKNAKRNEE